MDYRSMELHEIATALRKHDFSSKELTEAVFKTVGDKEKTVGAYITLTRERALLEAERVDKERASHDDLPALSGIPCAIKDNIAVEGERMTNASRMLEHFVPPYSAYIWRLLEQQGTVLIGKANMDEFAMGHSTETSAFHLTRNPYDLSRVPGGSSGGSAAAVASGEACFAIGTDTGGSIRQPAALCGLVGMRPTYGLVSRRGITAFSSSLDQAGPMTRSVRDNALVLDAIARHDTKDVHSVRHEGPTYTDSIAEDFGRPVIGWPKAYFESGDLNPEVRQLLEQALTFYEAEGAEIVAVDLKTLDASLAAYYIISSAEGFAAMNRYDGVHYGRRSESVETIEELYIRSRTEGLGAEVKQRILLGCFALSEEHYRDYYLKAAQVRSLVNEEFQRVFKTCDAILTPVTATAAWPLGTLPEESGGGKYGNDRFTLPASLAGMPALSVPIGIDKRGLPVAMQLMGNRFREGLLYRLAARYEDEHGLLPIPEEVSR